MNDKSSSHGPDASQPYLPPVPPAVVSRSQLPPDIGSFFGRSAELKNLRGLVCQETTPNRARVVVISGKPGVGKSTLAIHFAHEIKSDYPDAQLYTNLRASQSSEGALNGLDTDRTRTSEDIAGDILADFLRALGVQGEAIPSSLAQKRSLYRSMLANRSVLILVDDVMTNELIDELIPASASSLVLVTSRGSLAQQTRLLLDVLDEDSGVQLLAASVGGDKIEKEPAAALEVVRRCGGLPLAIVIAGARLATRASWSVNSLAWRLQSNKSNILDELRFGGTEVAASFSLSYQALTSFEQTLFRRLAVFTGPHFDDAAAGCLVDPQHDHVATTLERLADLQLLEPTAWDDCYEFHDLLREFAKLHFEVDEPDEVKQRCVLAVLKYYDQELEDADRALQPTSVSSARATATDPGDAHRLTALKWLTRERENLVAAVKQAVANAELDLAWRIAGRLASFFEVRAHYEDWLDTHEFVLRHLNRPEHTLGRATLTRSLGKLFYFQHNWQRAVSNYRDALQLFQSLELDREVGITLLYLGDTYRYQRAWDAARNTLTASLTQLQNVGFRRGAAIARRSLGAVKRLTGEFSEAIDDYKKALETFREIGDDRWIAATQLSMGDIYLDENRPAEAQPIFEECLKTFEEYGDRHWRALTLRSLGDSFRQQGNYRDARKYLDLSLTVLRKDGDKHWEAAVVEDLGELHAAQEQWPRAVERYHECLGMLDGENQDSLLEARARKNLGIALYKQGDHAGAKQQWRTAWLSYLEWKGLEYIEVLRLLSDGA